VGKGDRIEIREDTQMRNIGNFKLSKKLISKLVNMKILHLAKAANLETTIVWNQGHGHQ